MCSQSFSEKVRGIRLSTARSVHRIAPAASPVLKHVQLPPHERDFSKIHAVSSAWMTLCGISVLFDASGVQSRWTLYFRYSNVVCRHSSDSSTASDCQLFFPTRTVSVRAWNNCGIGEALTDAPFHPRTKGIETALQQGGRCRKNRERIYDPKEPGKPDAPAEGKASAWLFFSGKKGYDEGPLLVLVLLGQDSLRCIVPASPPFAVSHIISKYYG
jgi:hypothetical protein